MDYQSAEIGLLAARCAGARMPEIYRAAMRARRPIAALADDPALAHEWPKFALAFASKRERAAARHDLERWAELGIAYLVAGLPGYPEILLDGYDPPPILFYRGKPQQLGLGVAIVGSRAADECAYAAARELAESAARGGATIVSGLALGADTAAHRGSLESGSAFPTIAVLGTGPDKIYPPANRALANEIIERGGMLLSQFEPESIVYPSNFIARNRIISGLSRGVVVVQAAKNSGSLATARFALEEGRDVFVVPGAFGDVRYEGSHQLLREGAIVVTSADDLIDYYPQLDMPGGPPVKLIQDPILSALRDDGVLHCDELRFASPLKSGDFDARLLELELAGEIERLPGNMVRARHLK